MLPKLPSEKQRNDDRRQSGRLQKNAIQCSMGHIVDVSGTGLRLAGRGLSCPRAGELRTLTLNSGVGMVELTAKIVWARRLGLFKHQLGLQFVNLTPELQADLSSVLGLGRCFREPQIRDDAKAAFAA